MANLPPIESRGKPERPLLKLNRDEQRVLAITFVGGLASIIIGAGILGMALVIGRQAERTDGLPYLAFLTIAWVLGMVILGAVDRFKHRRLKGLLASGAIFTCLYSVFIGGLLVLMLIWIGIATGIK